MYGRPVDDDEMRYLRGMWRELRLANRIFTFGFGFGCLGGAVIAIGSVFLAQKNHDAGGVFSAAIVGLLGLGLVGLFGFLSRMSLRAARESFPAQPTVQDIEGPFRIQSTRARPFSWLGDNLVIIPAHWRRPIERAGAQRIFQAEVVDGPGAEMIVLTIGDKLSVSRDVERGLLALTSSLVLVLAMFAVAALILSAVPMLVLRDTELTLPRYLTAGHTVARFASIAEFRRAPPAPYTRVELRNVTLTRSPKNEVVAVDDVPDALLAEGAKLRAELAPLLPAQQEFERDLSNPRVKADLAAVKGDPRIPELAALVAARKRLMKHPELTEEARATWGAPRLLFANMLAARAKPVFVKAKEWVGRLESDAVHRGVPITGARDEAKMARDALDAASSYANRDTTIEDMDELERLLGGFDAAVTELPSAFRSKPILTGVVYPRRGGGVAVAIDESYSPWVLAVEALFGFLAVSAGILVLASVIALARRGPIGRRLRAALPDVA